MALCFSFHSELTYCIPSHNIQFSCQFHCYFVITIHFRTKFWSDIGLVFVYCILIQLFENACLLSNTLLLLLTYLTDCYCITAWYFILMYLASTIICAIIYCLTRIIASLRCNIYSCIMQNRAKLTEEWHYISSKLSTRKEKEVRFFRLKQRLFHLKD